MTLVQLIKSISFKSVPSLVGLALYYPLFVIPTLQATRKTMRIAQKEYGNAHKGNTKANAFRHALWNVLIAKYCLRWRNNDEKVIKWTKKITTKHEKLAPNPPLEHAMDLHNNKMGIHRFKGLKELQDHAIVIAIKKQAEKAIKVNSPEEVQEENTNLVYIERA